MDYSAEDVALAQLIGRRIKELRKDRGWGQADLEAHLDEHVTRSSLSYYETGQRLPSLRILRRMAEAFDVHISTFFQDPSNEQQLK